MSSVFDSGVRPAIDAYLKKKSEEVRNYGEFWSASSAGYCMRKNIFERMGVPHVEKDSDNRTTRVFEAGHIFHSWIQGITKDAGLSIAQEVELIDNDLMIKGHFDDLVLVAPQDTIELQEHDFEVDDDSDIPIYPDKKKRLILYDYKTAQSKWFEYAKGRPMSHYNKYQLGTYMYMLRRGRVVRPSQGPMPDWIASVPRFKDLSEARILKISKDDLRLHEIVLNWSPELEKEVVEYWRTLNGYWKAQTLPKCTCADFEKNSNTGVGFMADEKWNPFYYNGEPCSIAWYNKWKSGDSTQNEKPPVKLKPEILTHPNIPKPLHEVNPRNIMGQTKWNEVRQKVYASSGYICIACGVPKADARVHQWLEAHEYYDIDNTKGIVKIQSIEPLCHFCHNFIHSGRLSMIMGKDKSKEEIVDILEHGFKILSENKLECFPYTLSLAEELGANTFGVKPYKLKESSVEWADWRLVWDGKEYPPKYATYEDWQNKFLK